MYQALQPCYRRLPLQFTRQFSVVHARWAGHNKWSKIKDKKGVNDRQKSILYSKASNEIITAARIGGSVDPALNIRLAAALKSAKDQGVPKENIQKALARAGGASNGSGQHFVYEALAHDSVGLIIECLTDNANRTLHNVRDILTSYGARMTPVKFMFERQGLVTVALDKSIDGEFDKFFDIAIENGAEEVNERPDLETDGYHIYEVYRFSWS
ncbi:unnamed protein product [Cyclocybe aegerita]|uniref:Transcriptional regulator n=1 Tax=Cyclocybe aegerita TaxID=1973307 RepID=A0A8S0W9C9_CYCAE|nr:unnamed protein product [Cyclocybe aegerita]